MKRNSIILFQGDSITDCGRDYENINSLGDGYPTKINAYIKTFLEEFNITVINKGVSGNRVIDLQNRWQKDCLDINPDYLSILIGVNDMWRRYDSNDATSANDFKNRYIDLLEQAFKNNKHLKLILLEPFLLPLKPEFESWHVDDLNEKIMAVRSLARQYNAIYIPLDGIFASNLKNKLPEYWSGDGVHPTNEGHSLIATEWLERVIK